jgi:hypothetical protein
MPKTARRAAAVAVLVLAVAGCERQPVAAPAAGPVVVVTVIGPGVSVGHRGRDRIPNARAEQPPPGCAGGGAAAAALHAQVFGHHIRR